MSDGSILPIELQDFLETETVCCLAVPLPNGEVHTTPLLYWLDSRTLRVYMATSKETEKMWWHRQGIERVNASIVIGLTKRLPYLVQFRGTLASFDHTSDSFITEAYLERASHRDNPNIPKNTMIELTPTWGRYNDWKEDRVHKLLV